MFRKKTELDISRHEHCYYGKHHKIDYLEYGKKDSSHLIVTLSGFNGREVEGQPAKYNYMRTLRDIKANKLFIKDAVDNVPVYYMGTEGTSNYLDDICRLIDEKLNEMNIDKEQLIIAGSSKGGTGALLIGFRSGAGHIISGAQQLYVGSYLDSLNETLRQMIFDKMNGSSEEGTEKVIDEKFSRELLVDHTESKLYFHAGNEDPHYQTHMIPMLRHFDSRHILYELELRNYNGHKNVKYFFPDFLARKAREIIDLPFLMQPEATPRKEGTEVTVKVANWQKGMDWAIYITRKDNSILKIGYTEAFVQTVDVSYDDIAAIKVFLRMNGEKKQVKTFPVE